MAEPTRRTSLVMYEVIRPEGVAASTFSSPSLPTYQVVAEVPTFLLKQVRMRAHPVQGHYVRIVEIVNQQPIRFNVALPETLPLA